VTRWPDATNSVLVYTDLSRMKAPKAAHSIYFDELSENSWVSLALFLIIGAHSWLNCSWLKGDHATGGNSPGKRAWKTDQAVLVGY